MGGRKVSRSCVTTVTVRREQVEGVLMSHHYDYDSDKTKAERRERAGEKRRERMEQGKSVKLLFKLSMERAARAKRESDERAAREAAKKV